MRYAAEKTVLLPQHDGKIGGCLACPDHPLVGELAFVGELEVDFLAFKELLCNEIPATRASSDSFLTRFGDDSELETPNKCWLLLVDMEECVEVGMVLGVDVVCLVRAQ